MWEFENTAWSYKNNFFRMTVNTVANYCKEVKYENPDKFANILPKTGNFHIEMSFIEAIYK